MGNAAHEQQQLDVPGEVLDAAWQLREQLGELEPATAFMLRRMADLAAERWPEEDSGMWEGRQGTRHYVSSKVMCWVALDRAVKLADRLGDDARPERWASERDAVRAAVLEQGWCEEVGAYTGAFGSDHLDASVLLLPLVGFLPADDPHMRATIEAIQRDLTCHHHVVRWTGAEGAAFVICSFWLADCLARLGAEEEAEAVFDAVAGCRNDVGPLAEEIDPSTGEQWGNTPQALSHVGPINAAWSIEQARRR